MRWGDRMRTRQGWLAGWFLLLALSADPEGRAAEPTSPAPAAKTRARTPGSSANPAPTATPPARPAPAFILAPATAPYADVGLGTRLLWYLPNRLIDLADIFRLRVRVGPGLAANMRITDYGAFYVGEYLGVYAGLPGPRNPHYVRWPVGLEYLNGIVLGGVDATDNTPWGPQYGPTEVDVGLHLLVVGADIGIDPLEFADFLSGFAMVDIERDDYPRPRRPEREMTSAVSLRDGGGVFQIAPKPPYFDTLTERLDYLHTNVQQRVSKPVRTADEYFAPDAEQRVAVPDSRLRLGIYAEFVRGQSLDVAFKPDVDLDVALPNVEKRLHVFVQSGREDDLPSRTLSETANAGLTLGARRLVEDYNISLDAGIRTTWPPRAYTRATWNQMYEFEQWSFRPQQRVFFDTRDKLGSLSTLYVDRWLGKGHEFYAGSISSAKYTPFLDHDTISADTNSPDAYIAYEGDLAWEQTFRLGRVRKLIEERAYVGAYERRNIASGGDVSVSIFGTDSHIDTYRITVGMRRPLYQEWIFWEVEPGLEWTAENDYDTAFRITLGVDMLFWGPMRK